jgi:Ankyrin repeats (3 copies)/Ankyrin repeat
MPIFAPAPWKRSKAFQQKYLLDAIRHGNLKQFQQYYVSLQQHNYRFPEEAFVTTCEDDDPDEMVPRHHHAAEKAQVIDVDEPINTHGWTLLYYACFYRQTHMVEYMIQELYANIKHRDRFGNTVLHWACHSSQIRPHQEQFRVLVQILLEYSPSHLFQCNQSNELPMHWACRYGHYDVVVFMVEYCWQGGGGGGTRGTTHTGDVAQRVDLVLKLLRKADATNYTPRDVATNQEHWDIVRYLTNMESTMEQQQELQQTEAIR